MKKEDIYNGISGIRSEYLEEADAYKAPKRVHWKRWIAVAACFCLLICAAIPLFDGGNTESPFVITAYAANENGEMVGTPIKINQGAPMTQVELSTGNGGFLFSVDMEDKNAESRMNPITFVEGRPGRAEIEEVIRNYTEKKGKTYFYFVPDKELDADGSVIGVSCGYTKTDGIGVIYVLQIIKDNGTFTAKLMDVKELYPNDIPDNSVKGKDIFCEDIDVQDVGRP